MESGRGKERGGGKERRESGGEGDEEKERRERKREKIGKESDTHTHTHTHTHIRQRGREADIQTLVVCGLCVIFSILFFTCRLTIHAHTTAQISRTNVSSAVTGKKKLCVRNGL